MPPALKTLGAAGQENESKYRSGRGTLLLLYLCDGLVIKIFLQLPQLRLKANINEHAACKFGRFWTHPAIMKTSRINLFMFDASKLKCIYLCDGLNMISSTTLFESK